MTVDGTIRKICFTYFVEHGENPNCVYLGREEYLDLKLNAERGSIRAMPHGVYFDGLRVYEVMDAKNHLHVTRYSRGDSL